MEADEEDNKPATHPQKRMRRKEVLAQKKALEEIIRAASSQKDPLSSVLPCTPYHTKGLSVYLESGRGNKLTSHLKQYIQKLLKVNMEAPFGSEWPVEEKVKQKEMVAPEARYIFVYEDRSADSNQMSLAEKEKSSIHEGAIVGFVHYRFTVEEEVPVLYVYELQLEAIVQGKGLGKFLMELIEQIACKNRMGAVVLTVQKANISAMNFYMNKLGYNISATSPSRFSPVTGLKPNYEILCKAFDQEAKSVFEALAISSSVPFPYEIFGSQFVKEMCETNANNRVLLTVPHTLGSKPIRRKKLELESTWEQISRGKMYIETRTKSDGSFVNEEAQIAKIEEHDPTSIHVSSNDSLARVLGKEHAGRVRSLGSDICPNVAFGQPSYHASSSQQSSYEVSSSEIQLQKKIEGLKNELESLKTLLESERVSRQKWERAVITLYIKCGMKMPDDLANEQPSHSTQNEGQQHGSEDGGAHDSAEE